MSDRYKNNNVKTPKFSFNFISQPNNGNNNNNSNQNNEKKINKDKLEEEDGFDTDHDINMVNNSFSNKQKYDRNNDNIPNNIDDLIQEHEEDKENSCLLYRTNYGNNTQYGINGQ